MQRTPTGMRDGAWPLSLVELPIRRRSSDPHEGYDHAAAVTGKVGLGGAAWPGNACTARRFATCQPMESVQPDRSQTAIMNLGGTASSPRFQRDPQTGGEIGEGRSA